MHYFQFGSKSNQQKDPFSILDSELDLTGNKKITNNDSQDLLSAILSAPKPKLQPQSQQIPNKKNAQDIQHQHEYLKRAQKPIKQVIEKPKLFVPKEQSKQAQYQQKISEAKNNYYVKNTQKKYKPKVVDYLGFGSFDNSKKQINQKPRVLINQTKTDNWKKQSEKGSSKQTKPSLDRQKIKESRTTQKQVSSSRIDRQKQRLILRQRSRERQKQKKIIIVDRQRQRSKIKQQNINVRLQTHRNLDQKNKPSDKQLTKNMQKQREREKIQKNQKYINSQRQKTKQGKTSRKGQKDRQKQKPNKHKKSKKYSDQEDDDFIVHDEEDEAYWMEQLYKMTGKREKQKIFAERDKEKIVESSAHQIMGEDIISTRRGREEEEQDWRREQEERQRKLDKRKREQERRKEKR